MTSILPHRPSPIFSSSQGSGPPPHRRPKDRDAFTAKVIETNVLVVEDEMMIAWQIRDLLEDMGFKFVQTVGKFEDALAVAERNPPTLLICDVNLGPGPDGIATASALASHKAVQVIFITGYAGNEIRSRIEQFDPGAKLLRKPIQAKFLKDAILQVLGRGPN